jgi:predicted HicB family RNase H-like nuclease
MQKKLIVRVPNDLHKEVKEKAEKELRPISAVVRKLLEKWVMGEVDLNEE